jgi:hypothetical protein
VLPEAHKPVNSDLVIEYENLFIKVKEWDAFDDSDVERNGLCEYDDGIPVPEFVAEFEQKLDSKPGVAPDVCCFLDYSFDADGSM